MSSGSVPLLMLPGLQCVHSVFIHPMMAFIQYIIGTHESVSVNLLIVKLQREYLCCFYSIISYTVLLSFSSHIIPPVFPIQSERSTKNPTDNSKYHELLIIYCVLMESSVKVEIPLALQVYCTWLVYSMYREKIIGNRWDL